MFVSNMHEASSMRGYFPASCVEIVSLPGNNNSLRNPSP